LQTPAYAEAIIEATTLEELPSDIARARSEVRRKRQEQILERADPPALTVILDEAVLRREIGGLATMREQLDHLIKMAERDSIILVVVPFRAGAHPGLMGAFALMEYDDPVNDDVLCLETAANDVILRDNQKLIEQYRRAADRIEEIGLHEPAAMNFVERVRNELR